MKIVSIVNLKGGVGKSITAINLAHVLSTQYNMRVLVVDVDPQNDVSRFYRHGDEDALMRLMSGAFETAQELIVRTAHDNITLIPASYAVYGLDVSAHLRGRSGFMDSFRTLVVDCEAFDLADIVLVDCPPSFNASCCAALVASTDVIIPTTVDAFSVRGMDSLVAQLDGLKSLNPGLKIDGILLTMWHNSDVVKLAEQSLRRSGYPCFATVIRRTDKVPESTWASEPLSVYSKRSAAAIDYNAFAAELWEMWGYDHGQE